MSNGVKYVIDGSNVCQWAGKSSVSLAPLLSLVLTLRSRRESFLCYFDANIAHVLEEKAGLSERQILEFLLATFPDDFCVVTGGIQADPFVLQDADRTDAKVISNDRYKKYVKQFPWIANPDSGKLLKGTVFRQTVRIPEIEIYEPLKEPLELRRLLQIQANSYSIRKTTMTRILPAETGGFQSIEARLIVFALDASGSMRNPEENACATFDGRRKSDHLTEILRRTVDRLLKSTARDSFYISFVSFAGDAAAHHVDGAPISHVTRVAPYVTRQGFDYAAGSSGYGTNLSNALKTSVSVIDDALDDPKNKELASVWHALVVLITDGRDTVDEKAVYAQAGRIATQRAGLSHKTVTLAGVAIGDDCQMKLLGDIVSEADDLSLQRLEMKGLTRYLVTPAGERRPRLLIHVDANDANYGDVIRGFVDIVSHTV